MPMTKGAKALREQVVPQMNQTDLARKLGISKAAVSDWCSGKSVPKPEHQKRLQKLLGIPIAHWES